MFVASQYFTRRLFSAGLCATSCARLTRLATVVDMSLLLFSQHIEHRADAAEHGRLGLERLCQLQQFLCIRGFEQFHRRHRLKEVERLEPAEDGCCWPFCCRFHIFEETLTSQHDKLPPQVSDVVALGSPGKWS